MIGFRESGKDNSERIGSELIERDQDFVIAYGLMKDAVEYTIAYVDTAGNALSESEQYYGTIGDKPVITYRYFEGYQPQAYNLTKTLSANAADNVFTFIYSRVTPPEVNVITIPGQPGTPTPSAPANPSEPAGEEEGTAGGNVTVAPPEEETGGDAVPDEGGEATPDEGGEQIEIEEEPTPQALEEIIDLDEEQTPLADSDGEGDKAIGIFNGNALLINIPPAVKIGVACVFGILLIGGILLLLFRKKKKDEEEEKSPEQEAESGKERKAGKEEHKEEEHKKEEHKKEKRSHKGSGDKS